MAETFTHIEQFEGICSRAAYWNPIGVIKGFQHHPADYFRKQRRTTSSPSKPT
ncbi:MAG: hypothetical protein JJT96_12670 [Opitutales bacterium]|nr:hypothetical protein [Opitutales bacterium]